MSEFELELNVLYKHGNDEKKNVLKFTDLFSPPEDISQVIWNDPWKNAPHKDPVTFFESDLDVEKSGTKKFHSDSGRKMYKELEKLKSLKHPSEGRHDNKHVKKISRNSFEGNEDYKEEFFDFDIMYREIQKKEDRKMEKILLEKKKKKRKKKESIIKPLTNNTVNSHTVLGRNFVRLPKLDKKNYREFQWGVIKENEEKSPKKNKKETLEKVREQSSNSRFELSDDSNDDRDEEGKTSKIELMRKRRQQQRMVQKMKMQMSQNPKNKTLSMGYGTSSLIPEIFRAQLHMRLLRQQGGNINPMINRGMLLSQQRMGQNISVTNPLSSLMNPMSGNVGPYMAPQKRQTPVGPTEGNLSKLLESRKKVYRTKKVKAKMMQREKEKKAMEENIAESAMKANISVKKIESKTNTISKKSFNPIRNKDLINEDFDFLKGVDLYGKKKNMDFNDEIDLNMNMNDEDKNKDVVDFFDMNLVFSKVTEDKKKKKKNSFNDDDIDEEEQNNIKQEEEKFIKEIEKEINNFNLSNDRDYNLTGFFGETEQTGGRRITKHSHPARNLDEEYFPTNFHNIDIRRFHSQEMDFDLNRPFRIEHVPPRKAKRRTHREKIIKKKENLTSDHHRVILLQHIEDKPSLINNIGMGTRIVNYYKTGEKNVESTPDVSDGVVVKVKSRKELPTGLMGKLETGKYLKSTENNLYSAEIFEKKESNLKTDKKNNKTQIKKDTDFILTLKRSHNHKDFKFHIRDMPQIYDVGHIQEHMEVPAPGSRQDTLFNQLRTEQFVKRIFLSNQNAVVYSRDVVRAFPNMKDGTKLSKSLRKFCDGHKTPNGMYWTLKKGVKLDEKEVQTIVKPEMVCLDISMKQGILNLSDQNVVPLVSSSAFGVSDAAIAKKKYKKIIKKVEKKINKTPWNDTSSFIQIKKGKEDPVLKLIGVARENFTEENLERFQKQAHNEAVQQTEQKLHLTQQEARELIKSEGKTDVEIDKMTKQLQRHEANRIRDAKTKGATSKKNQKAKAKRTKINEVLFEIFSKESDKMKSNTQYYKINPDDYNKPEFEESMLHFDEEQSKVVVENIENMLDDMFDTPSIKKKVIPSSTISSNTTPTSDISKSIKDETNSISNGEGVKKEDSISDSGKSDLKSLTTGTSTSGSGTKKDNITQKSGEPSKNFTQNNRPIHMIKKTVRYKQQDGSKSDVIVTYLRDPEEIDAYTRRIEEFKKSTKKKKSKVFAGADRLDRFQTNAKEKRRLRDLKRKTKKSFFIDENVKKKKGKKKGRKSGYSQSMENVLREDRNKKKKRKKNLQINTNIIKKKKKKKRKNNFHEDMFDNDIESPINPPEEDLTYVQENHNTIGRKRKRQSSSLKLMNDGLGEIVNEMISRKAFGDFVYPVSKSLQPEELRIYRKEIGMKYKPICLLDMRKKCETLGYLSFQSFLDDMEMLRGNCEIYCEFRYPSLVDKVLTLYEIVHRKVTELKDILKQEDGDERPKKKRKKKHKKSSGKSGKRKSKGGKRGNSGKRSKSGKNSLVLKLSSLTPTPSSNPSTPNFFY